MNRVTANAGAIVRVYEIVGGDEVVSGEEWFREGRVERVVDGKAVVDFGDFIKSYSADAFCEAWEHFQHVLIPQEEGLTLENFYPQAA